MRRFAYVFALVPVICFSLFAWLWWGLPGVDDLAARARVPSSRVLDRHGVLLYELVDPRSNDAGRQTPIGLVRMSEHVRAATIAVEDASFYENPGVDVLGILRALWINLRGGEALAGGSTITQQLARQLLLDADERHARTLLRKVRESLLAWRIAQRYSKDRVLELYMNEIYYGNLAYGIEAAAHTYFGKSASELDLAESSLLAGLPQSPATYDPFVAYDRARQRQRVVLDLMVRSGAVSQREADDAFQVRLRIAPAPFAIRAPHFVAYARAEAERLVGRERLLAGGLVITTTIDLRWHDAAQASVVQRLRELAQPSFDAPDREAGNAAVLGIEPQSGAIRIMVGSPNYFDAAIAGAVNATTALRQPGSAIKPITYAAALAKVPGFTAATPLVDVRTDFPTREGTPYVPLNYDRRHHGILSARAALATSNNVAAVQVLQQVGLPDMLTLASDLGLATFQDGRTFGLALTLGGGEVRLIDLTAAYAAFAAGGVRVRPYSVDEIRSVDGLLLYRRSSDQPQRVLDARIAWLITDILADNVARAPAFGVNSVLEIGRPAAVKTGTTTDFRDNWTVGYTPQLAVGVWVGNADGSPMQRISGVSGAGPIWNDVMRTALRDVPAGGFSQPEGLRRVRVCALSGMLAGPNCPFTRYEWFLTGTEPKEIDTWHRREQGRLVIDVPFVARQWARAQGWPLAGETATARAPLVELVQPYAGAIVRIDRSLPRDVQRIPLEVRVRADGVASVDVIDATDRVVARLPAQGGLAFWRLSSGAHVFVARVRMRDGREVRSAPVSFMVLDALGR
jgi:penicillin-binding protein 1C